jgi:hypothetical protein
MGRNHKLFVKHQLPEYISALFSQISSTVTYEDTYHRVVVRVVYVVGELFYDLKEMSYESVLNVCCEGE